jgi:hypothetical protein
MTETLSACAILACLKGMGLSRIETIRDEEFDCWRIRAQGGPVVHIHDNGKVSISGLKARALRKELGLTGQRGACVVKIAERDIDGFVFLAENDTALDAQSHETMPRGRQERE